MLIIDRQKKSGGQQHANLW